MKKLVLYIDIDDTLIRSFGSKQIPITSMVQYVQEIDPNEADLYCWSSGGAEYARDVAKRLGIESQFIAFLPKPEIVIDDQAISDWRMIRLHPNEARSQSMQDLILKLKNHQKL